MVANPTNRLDVDQVGVPDGCVAHVAVYDSFGGQTLHMYWPADWNKIKSNQTVTVTVYSVDCSDGFVYAWDPIWNDGNQATRSCRIHDDGNRGDDCLDSVEGEGTRSDRGSAASHRATDIGGGPLRGAPAGCGYAEAVT